MMEVRATRPRANRAVAALSAAHGATATSAASLLPSAADPALLHRPITRYRSHEALEAARRQRWPLAEAYTEVSQLQSQHHPRDALAALPDAALVTIFEYLGALSRDGCALAACCRRARRVALTHGAAEVVCLVPDLLPTAADLARPRVLGGLCATFATATRGHHVRHCALVRGRHAAKHPAAATAPRPRLPLAQTLQLIAQMTYLQYLDVRGIDWGGATNAPAAALFLADLHLAAPRLRTLKVGTELCRSWPAGWWQSQPELATLVVSSRPEEAGCSTALTPPEAPLALDPDFFTMMASPQRPWRLTIWCPITREAMLRLLGIASPAATTTATTTAAAAPPPPLYPSVRELGLNLLGNTEACAGSSEGGPEGGTSPAGAGGGASAAAAAPAAGGDAGARQRAKPKRGVTSETVGDAPIFPALTALTIANVEERILSAAEVFGRFYVLAPALTCFNVCNTTRLPPPEKTRGKKKAPTGTADGA